MMNGKGKIISIVIVMIIPLLILIIVSCLTLNQSGGSSDPYEWIRPLVIIDFFRGFWLTR
jgi:hypothetical protein